MVVKLKETQENLTKVEKLSQEDTFICVESDEENNNIMGCFIVVEVNFDKNSITALNIINNEFVEFDKDVRVKEKDFYITAVDPGRELKETEPNNEKQIKENTDNSELNKDAVNPESNKNESKNRQKGYSEIDYYLMFLKIALEKGRVPKVKDINNKEGFPYYNSFKYKIGSIQEIREDLIEFLGGVPQEEMEEFKTEAKKEAAKKLKDRIDENMKEIGKRIARFCKDCTKDPEKCNEDVKECLKEANAYLKKVMMKSNLI